MANAEVVPRSKDQAEVPNAPVAPHVRRSRWWRVLVVFVIVLVLAGIGGLGYLVWKDDHREGLRRSASEDATRMITVLGSYDFADVDANLRGVTELSTPAFAARYTEVAGNLRELISNGKGTSKATVTRAAVESVDESRAAVLLFLDQQVTNVTVPKGRVDASRMVATLLRDGDSWKLDSADIV